MKTHYQIRHGTHWQASKKACPAGHSYATGTPTCGSPTGTGRHCRQCWRDRDEPRVLLRLAV